MGRYYNGDIEGKFWFGVQSSTDASFFGVDYSEQNYVNYYFDKDNLQDIENGIKKCKKELGKYKKMLDSFFNNCVGYKNEDIAKKLKITEEKVHELLKWYARLELGEKIYNCVKENGECNFEAEL